MSNYFNELKFIESHPQFKNEVTIDDWRALSEKLKNFITIKENGKRVYPMKDLYLYFMDSTDISAKMATHAILFALSSATKPEMEVYSDKGRFKLNFWTLLIGQSSLARKTTTERKIKKLLDEVDIPKINPNFTAPAIINVLRRTPQGSLVKSEVSRLLKAMKKDYNAEMPETLAQIYDCEDTVEYETRGQGHEVVNNPYVVMWGATTPFAYEYFTDDLFTQGFLQRFVYCLETTKYRYDPITFSKSSEEQHRVFASELLKRMYNSDIRLLRPMDTSEKWMEFQRYIKEMGNATEQHERSIILPYFGRLNDFAIKLIGILGLAKNSFLGAKPIEPDNLILVDNTVVELAIEITKLYETEFIKLIKKVRFINESNPVKSDRALIDQFITFINSTKYGVVSNPDLLNNSGFVRNTVDKVMATLREGDIVKVILAPKSLGRGTSPKLYYLKENFQSDEMAACAWYDEQNASDKFSCKTVICKICAKNIK